MSKIFVSIASYRDPELVPTIEDLIKNARNPNDLRICIGWQHNNDDKWDNLDKYKDDSRFTILDIPYKEAKGVCWMRYKIQQEYNNEDYYFQLDSHHRFVKDWDIKLKDQYNYLKNIGYYKPILSTYCPAYFPEKDPAGRVYDVWALNIDRFMPLGVPFLTPIVLQNFTSYNKTPAPNRFISAHFLFTSGIFVKEVPYDPDLYFHGEESSIAARAYTWGYDLFLPTYPIVWHEYTRNGKSKHWDDNSWSDHDNNSYAKFRDIFNIGKKYNDYTDNPDWKKYFGTIRSLHSFEKYAGIKFETKQIHIDTKNQLPPPITSDYESGLTNNIKYCIDIYKESVPEKDYEFFVVAFLDEVGNDIYRRDLNKDEVYSLINRDKDSKFINIWCDFESVLPPHSWRVWPNSKSKGWCDVIQQNISYE